MTWVALRSLADRRMRAALTAFAIVLGVAMIAGSLILTDTIDRAFTNIFSSSYTQTDLVVRSTPVVSDSFAGAPTVPAHLLDEIRGVPGVASAGGTLTDLSGSGAKAKLIGKDGKVIEGGLPTFGFGVNPAQPQFNPMTLASGHWATGPNSVVLDVATAKDHDFHIGDRVGVVGDGPVRHFTVTGLARFGGVDSLGGATIAVFDIPTARTVLGKTGFDAIQVAAAPGVTEAQLAKRITPLLPDHVEASTSAEQSNKDKAGISEFITFIRGFLLSFGGIALFVGAFVIFNTLSITVAQRSRELATLRTLGASRRQVMRSVIAEAFIIGLTASLVGLAAGYGLAKGLTALFSAVGLDMPQGATVFAPRTVIVSLLVGTLVTVLAGVVPAIRATRVAPITAVREGATTPRGRFARFTPIAALATIAVAGALLVRGLLIDGVGTSERLMLLGIGTLALFIGVAMVSSSLVRPIAAIVGWPIAHMRGASGRLARDNAVRNPGRTAATAAALMIGLALVTFVSVVGGGLLNTAKSDIESQLKVDHVVTSASGSETVSPAVARTIAAKSPSAVVSGVRQDRALVEGSAQDVSGIDASTVAKVYDFHWSAGSPASLETLATDGAIVDESFAKDHHLGMGDTVEIESPSGDTITRTVTGIIAAPRLSPLLGAVMVSQQAFDGAFEHAADRYVFVSSPAGASALESTLASFPDTAVKTVPQFTETQTEELTVILNLLYVLLALSVIVSLFGMVNTLALAVHERTREIGMLRAVGMTRRQARGMVRGESIITSLIGAALGIPLGIAVAALTVRSLSEWGVRMSIPVGSLVIFAVVAIVVGVIAAVIPARRASRLNVLRALRYE